MGKKDSHFLIINFLRRIRVTSDYLELKSLCFLKNVGSDKKIDTNKVKIRIGEQDDIATIKFKKKSGNTWYFADFLSISNAIAQTP